MALSASVIVTSGEEGSMRAVVAATAISGVAPVGWADPRGHVERKKANLRAAIGRKHAKYDPWLLQNPCASIAR